MEDIAARLAAALTGGTRASPRPKARLPWPAQALRAAATPLPGLSATDMERRVVLISERAYSTTVNGISRIESQSTPGIGLLKVYFQPGTEVGTSISQINSVNSSIIHIAPPGMTPPTVIQYNAANVPVVQMTISSQTLPEQQLADYALNFIRIKLFTIPGLSTPAP